MKIKVETLLWDSAFFGYKVGKCDLNSTAKDEIHSFLTSSQIKDYRLIYFFLNRDNSNLESILEYFPQLKLVDTKMEFVRKIFVSDQDLVISSRCVSCRDKLLPNLEDIALQSGFHSRFHTDASFVNLEFERLYTEWIKRSLNREIADEVFVCIEDDRALGLVSLAQKNLVTEIGLMAVDHEKRTKGIGSELIRSAIKKTWEWDLPAIKFTTQRANKTARKFFEHHGFSLHRETNIYHMWNTKKRIDSGPFSGWQL